MNIDDIRHVFVIGAGTMGSQIALRCAAEGYKVTVYDISSEALEKAADRMRSLAEEWVSEKHLTSEQAQAAFSGVRLTSDPQDAANADLVSESVVEDPEVKAKVFAQFAKICPARAIFTTNSSTLVPSTYASATGRPEQFAALHFYNVWDANMVDIAPHPGTNQQTLEILKGFATRIGQIPIVLKKEYPGYIGNALVEPFFPAAIELLIDGVHFEDVDRAAMIHLGMRAGPCAILDTDGLDFMVHMFLRAGFRSGAEFLKRNFVDKGLLGKKSGKGFYDWPNPAFVSPDFLAGVSAEKRLELKPISEALISKVLPKAVMIAAGGFAAVDVIDKVAVIFPGFGEGPFVMMDSIGLDIVLQDIETRFIKLGPEAQVAADWLKKEYVDKGWLGKKTGRGFYSWPNLS
jgi:3-hydroxybutyryl-CoA dehydrogenase